MNSYTASLCAAVMLLAEAENLQTRKRKWSKEWLKARDHQITEVTMVRELREENESDFRNYLRMDQATFDFLYQKVHGAIIKKDTTMRLAVPAHTRFVTTLRFLATGRSLKDLSYATRVSPQCLSKIVMETCVAIQDALSSYIKLPQSADEWIQEAQKFENIWQFPHCLGAIDGKHIQIQKPPNSGATYYNYKGNHSIVLLAVCNANYEFLSVDVGTNGRISDGGVLRESSFGWLLENQQLNLPPESSLPGSNITAPYVFIGDEAFPLRTNLIKPYSAATLTSRRIIHNNRLARARNVVECAFGHMTSRFQIYRQAIRLSPEKTTQIVLTTSYLHNFLIKYCPEYLETIRTTLPTSTNAIINTSNAGSSSRAANA
uniref:DDE Tnp4 domain-containing protein n=1 Tax=Anopheles funestus TaxID=62324 RepID=A0A182S0E7_ANOFN